MVSKVRTPLHMQSMATETSLENHRRQAPRKHLQDLEGELDFDMAMGCRHSVLRRTRADKRGRDIIEGCHSTSERYIFKQKSMNQRVIEYGTEDKGEKIKLLKLRGHGINNKARQAVTPPHGLRQEKGHQPSRCLLRIDTCHKQRLNTLALPW